MNVILSLVLSFVMLFSGTAGLPAIPETAATYTLSDISITYGDESVDLNPALRFTSAAGSERAEVGVEVLLDDQVLFPLDGRISKDGVSFSLADGTAYSISAEVLDEVLGLDEDSDMQLVVQLFERFAAIIPALNDPAVEEALSEITMNALVGGVEPEETEIDIDGTAVPAMTYTIEITVDKLVSVLDAWLACDIPAAKDFCQLILDIGNMESGTQYASFAEVFAAEEMGEFSLPIDLTIAEQDGVLYEQVYVSAEVEEQVLDLDAVAIQNGEDYALEMNYYLGGDAYYTSYSVMGMQSADGSFELVYDISEGSSYSSVSETEEAETVYEADTYILMAASGEVNDEGLLDVNFSMDATNVNTSTTGDEVAYTEDAFAIGGQVYQGKEEDGSVTSDCYFSLNAMVGEDEVTADISFLLNAAEGAYVDPFEGETMLALTADDLSGDSETPSDAMNQLMMDVMGLYGGVMAISADESINALMELGAEEINMDSEEAYVSGADEAEYIEEEYIPGDYAEYSMDNPENLDEAIAIYGHDLPEIAIPEGSTIAYAYATEDYLNVDYENGEDYFGVTYYPIDLYNGTETLILHPDGSFTEPDGIVTTLSRDEDGSIYYVDLVAGDTGMNIYSYSGTLTIEDVQAMLAGVV